LPTPDNRDVNAAYGVMQEISQSIFFELKRQNKSAEKSADGDVRGSFMEVLAAAYDEETKTKLSDQEVKDNALVIMFAGSETTSWTMSWTIYFLLQYPAVHTKLLAELDEAITSPDTYYPSVPLPYFDAVLKEVMRVQPITFSAAYRRLQKDTILGDWQVGKGAVILCYNHMIHLNPNVWGADAAEFKPERWLDETNTVTKNPFAYMPFGAGRRMCLGRFFADVELRAIFPLLIKTFNFKLIDNHPPIEAALRLPVLAMRNGLHLILEKR